MSESLVSNKLIVSYSLYSSVFLLVMITFLYFTELFLNAGNSNFVPFLILLVCVEVVKCVYFKTLTQQSSSASAGSKKWNKSGNLKDIEAFQVISQVKIRNVFKTIFLLISFVVLFAIIAVLFGAEFLSKHEETLMFSLLLVIQGILPICLHLGPDMVINFLLAANPSSAIDQVLLRNFYFLLIGAWLGAFVIPLDWDRPWQVWPIPCSSAAILGCFVANLLTCVQYNSFFSQKAANKSGKRFC